MDNSGKASANTLKSASSKKRGAKSSHKKKASKTEQAPLVSITFTAKTAEKKDETIKIYMSYNGQHKGIVHDIAAFLKQQKIYEVWIDTEKSPQGWNFDAMIRGIEQADIALIFLSKAYKNSESCRAEATLAKAKMKEILVIKLQHPCEPDGWLESVCSDKPHVNFVLRYKTFATAAEEMLKQLRVLSDKVNNAKKPNTPAALQRSKSFDKIPEQKAKSLDEKIVENAVERMELRRFDALKLTQALQPYNKAVFDAQFLDAVKAADSHQHNGGIFELCKRLARTEAKAFVLTAKAARSAGMNSLAEAIEDTVVEHCYEAAVEDVPKAARLLLQLLEGLNASTLLKRKSHIMEEVKRLNRVLYLEIVDVQNARRKDASNRLYTLGKKLRRYGMIPVPDRDDTHYLKSKNEDAVKIAITKLCEEMEGIVVVVGEGGLGKSLLVAKLALDDEFLIKVCSVDVVVWMNVYEISSPGLFMDERRFYIQLAEAIGFPINFALDMAVERQLERALSNRDRPVLLILEDVLSSHILALTSVFEKYLRVVAISPNRSCVAAACNRYNSTIITFDKLPQLKIETFLAEMLPPSIDRLQVTSLAMLCDGLPLVAKMIASQFVTCRDAGEVEQKYRSLVERNLEKLSIYSPRDMVSSSDKVTSIIGNIFHLNFEREPRELFRRYSSFLWFGVEEMVEVSDIALLWGCSVDEVAPFCNEHFCSKSLLQVVDVYEALPEAAKRQCYTLHSFLHHVALSFARKRSKSSKRYSLADMAQYAGRTYPDRRDGENILHLAIRFHKRAIFTAVVSFIADDAELLLSLCLEKETTNQQTPLDYLYAEEWKDQTEFHLYKDTALGLMFLLYEKMAASKVKPGYGVEAMIKQLRTTMDGLLAKILSKIEDGKDEPLLLAARENFGALAVALLERGAYPNTRDREDGHTALTLFARHGNEALVRLLLRGQSQQTWFGLGLVKAAVAGQESVVSLLLDKGASPDSVDDDGESAVIKAVKQQNEQLLSLLLDRGADPNVMERNIHTERFNPSRNVTALMLAVELGNDNIVRLLLHHFADTAAKNSFGETALAIAVKRGQRNIVEILKTRTK